MDKFFVESSIAKAISRPTVINRHVFGLLAAYNLAGPVQKKGKPVPIYAALWSQLCIRRVSAIGKPMALPVEALAYLKATPSPTHPCVEKAQREKG